ncbi:MAG: transposase, partial [Bacteroidetes bacterium]|nr:transposase [Bacteroidota bacterium]
ELKSKVALAAIKGNQTVNEIASEFGIHTSLVNRWKKEAIEALPLAFGNSQAKQTKETEIERDRLYQKVGQLGYGCVTGNSGAMPGPKFATFSNWELPKDKPS